MAHAGRQPVEVAGERRVGRGLGHRAVPVAVDHGERAAGEVAEVVGQLGLVPRLEAGWGDRPVPAERHLAEAVEAERVGPEALDHAERVEHVPQRLGHLLFLQQQEAVDEQVLRRLVAGGEQQRGPVHAVEFEDVLADELIAGRPERWDQVSMRIGIGQRRDVVQQRVEPHVEDLRVVPRHRHAPLQLGPCERNVLESLGDERPCLVEVALRHHEVGSVGVQLLELLLKARQREEPVLLLLARELDLVDRAAVAIEDLVLDLEVSAARAVPALVQPQVGVAVVVHRLQHLLDLALVLLVGGADEEVI